MKKTIISIIFLAVILIASKVEAAGSASLYANKSEVDIGEEFTVSISLSDTQAASFTARVTVDTSKVEYISGPANSNFRNGRIIYTWTDPNGGDSPITGGTVATFTLKARAAGNAGFSVSGDFYAPDESPLDMDFSGVTVTVVGNTEPEPTTVQTTEQTPTPTPTPTPTSTPTPERTPESTQPSNPTSATETPVQTSNSSNPTPNEVVPQETNIAPSSNTNLKSLRLDVALLSPNFAPDILNYETLINETISNIDVLAVPEDANSSIDIIGNNDLQMGTNLISVTVIAQNGDKKTYNITVNKTNEAYDSNSYLENLAIENVFLVPEFRFDEFNYKAEIASTQENINVFAVPQIEGATVSIQGQDNLNFGNNTITITVTSKNGAQISTYTILAYKKSQNEELTENELKKIDNVNLIDTNEKKLIETKKNNNNVLWVILIIGAIAVAGFFIWKYWIKKKKE